MFRKMRRTKQQLPEEETVEILKRNNAGTLAILGDDGYPYSVPVSYAYDDGRIIIHGAKSGHKVDSVRKCSNVSFSVIDQDQVVPEEYTTYFRSAIVFGKMRVLDRPEDKEEIVRAADILAKKFRPGFEKERQETINRALPALCILILDIEHMTGKEAIELTKKR